MPASALVRRVFIGLLVANLAVVGVKLWVGFASGSLAILGGAVDSCVDALNNALALIVIRVAAKEPDEDHPYGHGKFETLGALAIVGFLSITSSKQVIDGIQTLVSETYRVELRERTLAALVRTRGVVVPRSSKDLRYAEVTVCVDRHADVESAHAIADQVEERLKRDLQLHEVTVHVEPC